MLYLALYLPQLALDVFLRERSSTPCAETGAAAIVVDPHRRTEIVYDGNEAASRCGIRPGMKLSAALALNGALTIFRRAPHKERQALEHLAEWAQQFTPTIHVEPPAALLLEIQGCLDYFGGFSRLHRRIRKGLASLGYCFSSCAAPTCFAALWLARYSPTVELLEQHDLEKTLSALPLQALPLSEDKFAQLELIGIRTLGQLIALPRDGMAKRFGKELPLILDRALGRAADPRATFQAPEQFCRRIELQWAADKTDDLLFIGKRLLIELAGFLSARGLGVQAVDLHLQHRDCPSSALTVGFGKPTRQAEQMFAVLRERMERYALVAPVEEFEMRAPLAQPLGSTALDLFGDIGRDSDLELLHARLKARLGDQAVVAIAAVADHRPEKAWRRTDDAGCSAVLAVGERPPWLLSLPEALPLREERPWYGEPLRCLGRAERIESGWWDGEPVARSYFVALGPSGRRYWIFQQHSDRRWFLHGVFD